MRLLEGVSQSVRGSVCRKLRGLASGGTRKGAPPVFENVKGELTRGILDDPCSCAYSSIIC